MFRVRSVRAFVFEFSSQSSGLLYLGYAIDRHDTHLYHKKITRTPTHSIITKYLTRASRSNTGTFVRPSQENDFVFEMCDSKTDVKTGKRFFSFIAVGLNLSNQEEKVAEKKAPETLSNNLSSLTEAFRKKMVLDKSIHHDSIVSSCPAEFVPRFRPPQKIRQHIAMAASASPKQHTGRMFFERLRPLESRRSSSSSSSSKKQDKLDRVVELEEKLSKPIPLRRTISLPNTKQAAARIRLSPSRSTGRSPSSRRVRSDRQFRRSDRSASSGGFLGVFKSFLCMHEKNDTL